MPKKKEEEMILIDTTQKDMILFDENKNIFTTNQDFMDALAEAPKLVELGEKLLETDINELDEDDMTQLTKDLKPLTKYKKKFEDFRKAIKKRRDDQTKEILSQYDDILKQGEFDKIPELDKKLNVLKNDFKENRANKRWEELQESFEPQLEIYPELVELSPKKLASFSYYRVTHPDMVSSAKTKPITEKTIQALNQELNDYATDISLLKNSAVKPKYHKEIVDDYAAEPKTNIMLQLIDDYLIRQVKDDQKELVDTIKNLFDKDIDKYLINNTILHENLEKLCTNNKYKTAFNIKMHSLIKAEANAIKKAITPEDFIENNEINEADIDGAAKVDTTSAYNRIKAAMEEYIQAEIKKESQNTKDTPKQKEIPKEKPILPKDKNQWILDYLQEKGWEHIHNDNIIKMKVLIELTQDFATKVKDSVWRKNIKSPDQFMETVKYLTEL